MNLQKLLEENKVLILTGTILPTSPVQARIYVFPSQEEQNMLDISVRIYPANDEHSFVVFSSSLLLYGTRTHERCVHLEDPVIGQSVALNISYTRHHFRLVLNPLLSVEYEPIANDKTEE